MDTVAVRLQALQLIGLLLPVVVLVLRTYLNTYDDDSFKSASGLSDAQMAKKGALAAIASFLLLLLSGIIILGSIIAPTTPFDQLIFRVAIGCLMMGFIAMGVVVGLWLKQVLSMGKVEII